MKQARDEAVSKLSAERSKAKRHAEEALLRKQEPPLVTESHLGQR